MVDIHAISNRASPLGERLGGKFIPVEDGGHLQEDRWKKWSETLSRDDASALPLRLKLAGIAPEDARSLLGEVRPRTVDEAPSWTEIFRAAMESIPDLPAERDAVDQEDPAAAWDAFYQPFLVAARRLLRERTGLFFGRLSAQAQRDLEKALLASLRNISAKALEVEFAIGRAGIPGGIAPTADEKAAFARHGLNGGGFFKEYPGAARLSGLVVEFWVEAVAEFLDRLDADSGELERVFANAAVRGRIEGISTSLSDPHRRGRCVFIATFSDGSRLVYKPRSVGLEAAYFGFIDWLNARDCPLSMKSVRALDRGDHGWMEFVTNEPCQTAEEVSFFFARAGGLLALLYALAGSDMHLENLLAHGSHPVPIDLEVLMVPFRGDRSLGDNDQALVMAATTMLNSVLGVGLLPAWSSVGKGKVYNFGGLGAAEQPPEQLAAQVRNASTLLEPHKPVLDGLAVSSHLYREEIVQGFRTMYEFLLRHRDDILADGGPLARFQGEPVRFVNRATSIYARVLRRATSPSALASGVARSMELEVFMKSALHVPDREKDTVHAVCAAEILALEQGDVPFFQGRADSLDLVIPETGVTLENFFTDHGLGSSRRRIQGLSLEDLEIQTKFIRLSFDLVGDIPLSTDARPIPRKSTTLSFREEALAISRTIQRDAIRVGGDVTWIAPQLIPSTENFQLVPMGSSLYDGSLGLMVFLLAIEARLGDQSSGDVGRQIFAAFRRNLGRSYFRTITRRATPGLHGLGGQIYALLLGGDLSGDGDMLGTAVELGDMLTDDAMRRQKESDLLGGLAGAIPALLALHAATGDRRWLERAIAGGECLLARREPATEGLGSWKDMGRFLAGYSHGAAGCASSLLRLHAACGDERFREAATEAIAYENTLFDLSKGNWKDLRREGGFMASWCHGAPGILLGRILGGERDSEDVRRAMTATMSGGLANVDQCCCGNAGRADILLSAAAALDDDRALGGAREIMEQTVMRAGAFEGYACYGLLPRTVRGPGFFQGLAGIGYTLLRLESSSDLPSVLAMETPSTLSADTKNPK